MTAAIGRLNSRTFASLRYRNYRLFFGGQAVSQTGSWMQRIALGWFVLPAHALSLRRRRDGIRTVRPLHGLRPVRRRARRPARRPPHRDRDAGRAARNRLRPRLDRARRVRAAVDALPDRVRERDGARPRRAVAPAAHLPDGRPRGPPERDRAQLEPLQRVAHLRPGGRGHGLRLHGRRHLLPDQRDHLPGRPAQPLRDAGLRLLPARAVRAALDPEGDAGGARVRADAAADARPALADRRAQHVLLQLQRDAAGARGEDAAHERAGLRPALGRSSAAARSSARWPRPPSAARPRR